jgi:hypothetical protein
MKPATTTTEKQEWELMNGGAKEAVKGTLVVNVAIGKRKV